LPLLPHQTDFLPDGKTLAELPEHDIALTAAGSGTGVSVSDLRIIEIDEAGFKDTYFEPDDYVQQV